jgi:hypothetical protein
MASEGLPKPLPPVQHCELPDKRAFVAEQIPAASPLFSTERAKVFPTDRAPHCCSVRLCCSDGVRPAPTDPGGISEAVFHRRGCECVKELFWPADVE